MWKIRLTGQPRSGKVKHMRTLNQSRSAPLGTARHLRAAASFAICVGLLCNPGAVGQNGEPIGPCDPDQNIPTTPPSAGCEWVYENGFTFDYNVITLRSTEVVNGPWVTLPFCACGWYPATVTCPSCPPTTATATLTDTFTWSISTTMGGVHHDGLLLKWAMIADIGYTGQFTYQEHSSLGGTKTINVSQSISLQQIMCFSRFYRKTGYQHYRMGKRQREWTLLFYEWCNGVRSERSSSTSCIETLAYGFVNWETLPVYEWAPQKPPCGGVPVTNPDPWDGKREMPCCATVCEPPPPPAHPCCGCEVH